MKYRCLLILIAFFFIVSCGKKTTLDIEIISQPEGGSQVSMVSCSFRGRLIGGDDPITATVEWWWEGGYIVNQKLQFSEEYTFTDQDPVTYTTSLEAPIGYILLNYYWVKIIWSDAEGDHKIESWKAHCTL